MSDVDTYGEQGAVHTATPRQHIPGVPSRAPPPVPDVERQTPNVQPRGGNETEEIDGMDSVARVASGPGTAVHVSQGEESYFPQALSAQVETLSPGENKPWPLGPQEPYSQYSTDDRNRDADARRPPPVPPKPRVVSSSSGEGELVPPQRTKQRSDSPQIIAPEQEDQERSRHEMNDIRQGDGDMDGSPKPVHLLPALQYHHQRHSSDGRPNHSVEGRSSDDAMRNDSNAFLFSSNSRPSSVHSVPVDSGIYTSPGRSSAYLIGTPLSQDRRSSPMRPLSAVDLLSLPYAQQTAPTLKLNHTHLQGAVGTNASLLSTKQTLEMYRANVKKTNDQTVQYSFAVFMVETANEMRRDLDAEAAARQAGMDPAEMIGEARQILHKLSDKGYPFAQYYLADGFASGLFGSKGKPDDDKAFPLFVSASKHGHAESGYRAALCYEFGWGTRKDPLKAVQFYRQAASKNHPGAMLRLARACLSGDLGLGLNKHREGIKWLKRAAEAADTQYNSAPYELGLLHVSGYGDDVFADEAYAAQLFTQSADLGHPDANFILGDAYEHGKLKCPRDPALSVHFYHGGASRGHAGAMMALCAWYMVGAPPILEKDENEAYEWAAKAAALGLPKAQYAIAYFTEMGIGCRRDPLEANVWYVRAADQGEERAKKRIAAIQIAASGGPELPTPSTGKGSREAPKGRPSPTNGNNVEGSDSKEKPKRWGIF